MGSRPLIEQAKGMLMMRYSIDDEAAFAVLQRWSMNSNIKLRDLAAALSAVVSGQHDGGIVEDESERSTGLSQPAVLWVVAKLRHIEAEPAAPAATLDGYGADGQRA